MSWFELKGDERLGRCATANCGGQPTSRMEADGVGSNYCSGCRAAIEAVSDAYNYGIGFTRTHPDGRVERIPPEQVIIHGNGQSKSAGIPPPVRRRFRQPLKLKGFF